MQQLLVLSVLAFSSRGFANSIDNDDITLRLNIAINTAEGQIKKESVEFVRDDGILKALSPKENFPALSSRKGIICRISLQCSLCVFLDYNLDIYKFINIYFEF